MEEKKRKKNKKKNRSGPASSDVSSKVENSRQHESKSGIHNITASPSDDAENSSTHEEDKQGAAARTADDNQKRGSNHANGFCHGGSEAVAKQSASLDDLTNLLVEEASLRSHLQAKEEAISKLREALEAECARSSQLHSALLELETTYAASQASSQQHIHQLELEVGWLKEREVNQKDVEIELNEKILGLRSEIMQLRAAKERKEALMQEDVQQVRNDNAQLRGENVQLMEEVEKMKRHIDQFLLERKQLIAKMAALQTGMHQLEREAAIRGRVGNELAEAVATTSSKGWLRWSSGKDPIAEAAAVAEDSRVQLAAAATMIEKLSADNAALVDKVNEQSALIDRLSSNDNHAMELHKDGNLMTIEGGKCEERNSANQQMTMDPKTPELLNRLPREQTETPLTLKNDQFQIVKEEVLRSEPYETVANGVCANSSAADAVSAAVESSANDSLAGDGISDTVVAVDLDHQSKIESSNEIVAVPSSQNEGTDDGKQGDALLKQFEPKPFSDAPIMGAPIRLFTFVTKYVSGADLVKVKNSS